MAKEITCIDEVLVQDMVDDVSDSIIEDDGFGSMIDVFDDDYSDGDLIDLVVKGGNENE